MPLPGNFRTITLTGDYIDLQAYPKRAQEIHRIVAQGLPGMETAYKLDLPYTPDWEGFWHGVYGEVEYQRWASR